MATSMQVEAEPNVECAVQQISNIEVEGEEEQDPLEGPQQPGNCQHL